MTEPNFTASADSTMTSLVVTSNITSDGTGESDDQFTRVVSLLVPLLFGLIVIIGLTGNFLVILVVTSEREMRNTTNVLILGLALADLGFIVTCVPFTAVVYAASIWPFGEVWCKVIQ